jgi:hypothetical protein
MTKAWATLLMIFTLAALVFTSACTKPSTKHAFLYTNAVNGDRDAFVNAFATEHACNGVTLDAALGDEPRLHYNGNVFAKSSIPVRPRYIGYIVMPDVPDSNIDFAGDTVQAAVRQACAILTNKGGTVGGTQ